MKGFAMQLAMWICPNTLIIIHNWSNGIHNATCMHVQLLLAHLLMAIIISVFAQMGRSLIGTDKSPPSGRTSSYFEGRTGLSKVWQGVTGVQRVVQVCVCMSVRVRCSIDYAIRRKTGSCWSKRKQPPGQLHFEPNFCAKVWKYLCTKYTIVACCCRYSKIIKNIYY